MAPQQKFSALCDDRNMWGTQGGMCIYVCLVLAAGCERAAGEKSSFPSIVWKQSLFPDCWLCLFSATQTLSGKWILLPEECDGCGLHDGLMVVFLKGQPACSLCPCGMWYVVFIIPKWQQFELDFCSFPYCFGCPSALPASLKFVI